MNASFIAAISAAVIGGLIGFLSGEYNTNYGAQLNGQSVEAAELRMHDLDIESLKAKVAIDESSIGNFNAVANQVGALKSVVEDQTRAVEALQRQVNAMDHWLRPDPTLGHGH